MLAPSVSELAQPLASEGHIDEELLESLRVIWGRHGNSESIKADLLSPQGEGTLAKAFYFLLQRYREQTLKDHGIILDEEPQSPAAGKIVTKQYRSPTLKKPSKFEIQLLVPESRLQTGRDAPPPPSRTPSPSLHFDEHPSSRASSHVRPPSPVGPRLPRNRPLTSPIVPEAPIRHKSMRVTPVSIEPANMYTDAAHRTRSSTVSMLSSRIGQDPHSYHAHNQHLYQPMHIPNSPCGALSVQFPVSPLRHSAQPFLSPNAVRSPASILMTHGETSPLASSPIGRYDTRTIPEDRTDQVRVFLGSRSATQGYEGQHPTRHHRVSADPLRSSHAHDRHRQNDGHHPTRGQDDKENRERSDGKFTPQESDLTYLPGGLFTKSTGGRVGRELRNSLHGHRKRDDGSKDKEKRVRSEFTWLDLFDLLTMPRSHSRPQPGCAQSQAIHPGLSTPAWFACHALYPVFPRRRV